MGLSSNEVSQIGGLDTKPKAPALKCPRCESANTKFCYYNNYSRLQPRYFCKGCRRHWTAGGTLRNVPLGGGRKNRRTKTNRDAADSSSSNSNSNPNAGVEIQRPPFGFELESSVFPEILQQVLMSDSFGTSLMPGVGGAELGNFFSVSNSSSCSSPHKGREVGGEENLVSLMDGYNGTSSWARDPLAMPASYWSCWDGGMEYFAAAPEELQ